MRTLLQVITTAMKEIAASVVLLGIVLFAVNDFSYFKRFIVTGGPTAKMEYYKLLAKHFRIFLFADFIEEINEYDWIDYGVFVLFTLVTMLLLTNILISFMGDAHERVQATLAMREGYYKIELLLELEIICALKNPCDKFTTHVKDSKKEYIYMGEKEKEDKAANDDWEGRVETTIKRLETKLEKMETR